MKRINDLYVAIDNVMQENEYYDDEIEDTCCDVTEEQVYKMVRMLLPAVHPQTPDESDAIAIALAHANTRRFV